MPFAIVSDLNDAVAPLNDAITEDPTTMGASAAQHSLAEIISWIKAGGRGTGYSTLVVPANTFGGALSE